MLDCIACTAWYTPAKPAAGSVCPMLLLPAAKVMGRPGFAASEVNTAVAAATSIGSPRFVPAKKGNDHLSGAVCSLLWMHGYDASRQFASMGS